MANFTNAGTRFLLAAAVERDANRTGAVAGASHLTPGLAVFFVVGVTSASGRKIDLAVGSDRGNRYDIPGVNRDDVSNDEVDLIGGVSRAASTGFDDVTVVDKALGGLDLDAPKFVAGVEDEVVALALAPGLGDAEAQASGFGEKGGFDGLAARFARGEANGVDFYDAIRGVPPQLGNKKAQPARAAPFFSSYF